MGLLDLTAAMFKPKVLAPGRALPSRVVRGPLEWSPEELSGYSTLVAHRQAGVIPPFWPQVKAASLHTQLFSARDFPLSPLGMVHVENVSTHLRDIEVGTALMAEAECVLKGPAMGGLVFELVTRVEHAQTREALAEYRASILVRAPKAASEKRDGAKKEEPAADDRAWKTAQTLDVPSNQGRRYARVSRDFNPIHLTAPTAKLLGFKRAIAHGMWTLARLTSETSLSGPRVIAARFKKPLFLPGRVMLETLSEGTSELMRVRDDRQALVEGRVSPK